MRVALAIVPSLWAAPEWVGPALLLGATLVCLTLWSWRRSGVGSGIAALAVILKLAGVLLLVSALAEPMVEKEKFEPQANLVVILADDSRSLSANKVDGNETWADALQRSLAPDLPWRKQLATDFEVREFSFGRRIQERSDLHRLPFDDVESNIFSAIDDLTERFANRPLAGIVILTDGIATDSRSDVDREAASPASRVPIFPIVLGDEVAGADLCVARVSTAQTNFESAPTTIAAEIEATGFAGRSVTVRLIAPDKKVVETQQFAVKGNTETIAVRFTVKPEGERIAFYRIAVSESVDSQTQPLAERAVENNERTTLVDRSGGPFRVLYVCGRPNWEFKFLRRSLAIDDEIDLVGLIRIAKREAKFDFRSDADESNALFRGFESNEEIAEQYDEPVLLRVGTNDADELRSGFPNTADDLFAYHAVILDDLEADFFTQDQMSLLSEFVSVRGGGLLMLGGQESFHHGKYGRTPIGDLLPVYVDRPATSQPEGEYRFTLSQEGWLESWTRLRATEASEQSRLESLPPFATVNRSRSIKPGARVLAEVLTSQGDSYPALVTQAFGRGRTAAFLIGDAWKSHLGRNDPKSDDLGQTWRQTVRWLVADVPRRVQPSMSNSDTGTTNAAVIRVEVRDEKFQLLDNAEVSAAILTPNGETLKLTGRPVEEASGLYEVPVYLEEQGGYHAMVTANGPDGSEIGTGEAGISFEPLANELSNLRANRELLQRLAEDSGGQLVQLDELQAFVASLRERSLPVKTSTILPLWHSWFVMLLAMSCLVAEWGLRRWKGLP